MSTHRFKFPLRLLLLPVLIQGLLSLAPAGANEPPASSPAAGISKEKAGISKEKDWPWWRGPSHDGIAHANQKPPREWGREKNVLWKAPIPGRGHGSPVIVGDQVLLTTADLEKDARWFGELRAQVKRVLNSTCVVLGQYPSRVGRKVAGKAIWTGNLPGPGHRSSGINDAGADTSAKRLGVPENPERSPKSPRVCQQLPVSPQDGDGSSGINAIS